MAAWFYAQFSDISALYCVAMEAPELLHLEHQKSEHSNRTVSIEILRRNQDETKRTQRPSMCFCFPFLHFNVFLP